MEFLNLLMLFVSAWLVIRRPQHERLAFRLVIAGAALMVALFCLATRGSLLPVGNY